MESLSLPLRTLIKTGVTAKSMKVVFSCLILIFITFNSFGIDKYKTPKDSVGVYVTKADFLDNHLSDKSQVLPKVSFFTSLPRKIDPCIYYGAGQKITFMVGDSVWQKFNSNNMFGFYVNGYKYVYVKGFGEFRQVIYAPPFYFYPEISGIKSHTIWLYFSKNNRNEPVIFIKRNIRKLKADAATTKTLLKLYRALIWPLTYNIAKNPCYTGYVDTISEYMAHLKKLRNENNNAGSLSLNYVEHQNKLNDSVGIYQTEADYLHNHLSFQSNVLPKATSFLFPFYSKVNPEWSENIENKIKFRNDSLGWKKFKHGSPFGFYINGHKFIYVKGFCRYMQVIYESPFYFYLDIDNIKSQQFRILYFAKDLNETPALFNKKNIRKLNTNISSTKVLLNFYHSITGFFGYTSTGWLSYKNYVDTISQYMVQFRKAEEEEENKNVSPSLSLIPINENYSIIKVNLNSRANPATDYPKKQFSAFSQTAEE